MGDWELLQDYVQNGSRQSMDELVRRHMSMVYAAALREVGDPHTAEDVSQAVFIVLMRRAAKISRRIVLPGWLFHTTRYVAANAVRSRRRRNVHERKAAEMTPDIATNAMPGETERALPLLNSAVAALPTHDRDAVVMHYLQGKSCSEVAEALSISEETARQRLHRAVLKLRRALAQHGLAISEETLGAALTAAGSQSAPIHLAAHLATAIHAPVAGSAAALADSTVKVLMASAQMKIAGATAAAVVSLIAGVTTAVYLLMPAAGQMASTQSQSTGQAASPFAQPQASAPLVSAAPPPTVQADVAAVRAAPVAPGEYPKVSPFQAVRWNGLNPDVKLSGNWYGLVAINAVPATEIVSFAMDREKTQPPLARKHFNEDLPELMGTMGHKLAENVDLQVRDPASGQLRTMGAVPMTQENRQLILAADVTDPSINPAALKK